MEDLWLPYPMHGIGSGDMARQIKLVQPNLSSEEFALVEFQEAAVMAACTYTIEEDTCWAWRAVSSEAQPSDPKCAVSDFFSRQQDVARNKYV